LQLKTFFIGRFWMVAQLTLFCAHASENKEKIDQAIEEQELQLQQQQRQQEHLEVKSQDFMMEDWQKYGEQVKEIKQRQLEIERLEKELKELKQKKERLLKKSKGLMHESEARE